MSFLPYSGGGTGGWIGAFGFSALAHVGIVAGLVTLQAQVLRLAEIQSQQAAYDITVALESFQDGELQPVEEVEEPEVTAPEETALPAETTPESLPESEPELPEESEPEPVEAAEPELPAEAETEPTEQAEPEQPAEAEPEQPAEAERELAAEAEPEVPETTPPDLPEEAEPEVAEAPEPEIPPEAEAPVTDTARPEIPPELEAETPQAADAEETEGVAAEVATAGNGAQVPDLAPAETAEAGPAETAAPAAPEIVQSSPLAANPLASDAPGPLSPIRPEEGGVRVISRVETGPSGIGSEPNVAPEAVPSVAGEAAGLSGIGPITLAPEAAPTTAPSPSTEPGAAPETLTDGGAGETVTGGPAETITGDGGEIVTALLAPTTDTTPAVPDAAVPTAAVPETAVPETAVPGTAEPAPGAATPPSVTQAPVTAQDLALTDLIRRVRQAPSDPCLAALPRRDGESGVGLALMADDRTAMENFSEAFVTPEDEGLLQTRNLLDPRQCPAVSFIRNTADYPATRLGLRIDNDLVSSGGTLSGVVRGTPGRYLILMLIDDNGVVQDLDRFTSTAGDLHRFEVPVTRAGEPRETKPMLLAAAFTEPPEELRARMGQLAQDVFSGLPAALSDGADLAVATFDVR